MAKKIFALVLMACVLGTLLGGCSKPDDTAGGTATTTGTTGTTGGATK